ncbi:FGGY family carbohydrate kinase [Microbacterium sp. NPDC076911]|uniref:FGGY family carbohydrate kinase n=1 Tax=Microbacterium sp. NPDC076911 TaxID=3154958 RepID=UPI003416ABD3
MTGSGVVLGVDLATANARVVAVDMEHGATIATRSRSLPVPHGAGGVREQAPLYSDIVIALVAAVVQDLGKQASEVRAICTTGTSGTVVPTDSDGHPVAEALLYNDARGGEYLDSIRATHTGGRPNGALLRTAWLQRHRPSRLYLFTPDVVNAALAGRVLPTDTSHALKSGIDPIARTWDHAALDALGVPEQSLSPLVAPGTAIGTVDESVAATCGLPRGVAIIAGMTDGCTSQIATGAVEEGQTVGILGTTLVIKASGASDVTDAAFGVYSHVAPDGLFWAGGASNTGGGVLQRHDALGVDSREADTAAADVTAMELVSYPLAGTGERFPVVSSKFSGFTVDKTGAPATANTPIERHRADLEGIAFVERLGLERLRRLGVPAGAHFVSGGASSSVVWNTIRASVIGTQLFVPRERSSGFGAAILAAAALADRPFNDTVQRMAAVETTADPDPRQIEPLNERYARFLEQLNTRGLL